MDVYPDGWRVAGTPELEATQDAGKSKFEAFGKMLDMFKKVHTQRWSKFLQLQLLREASEKKTDSTATKCLGRDSQRVVAAGYKCGQKMQNSENENYKFSNAHDPISEKLQKFDVI